MSVFIYSNNKYNDFSQFLRNMLLLQYGNFMYPYRDEIFHGSENSVMWILANMQLIYVINYSKSANQIINPEYL
jgi:hypothetical protein